MWYVQYESFIGAGSPCLEQIPLGIVDKEKEEEADQKARKKLEKIKKEQYSVRKVYLVWRRPLTL